MICSVTLPAIMNSKEVLNIVVSPMQKTKRNLITTPLKWEKANHEIRFTFKYDKSICLCVGANKIMLEMSPAH